MSPIDSPNLQTWPELYMANNALRAKSVVMTLFGDVIRPHGGALWLGSLIRLLAPFGISDRLVRTSVFRLAEEGWLGAQREGRRSLYTLKPAASRRFEYAYKRIYSPTYLAWEGRWTMVLAAPGTLNTKQRADMRKELHWEGFRATAPTAYVHPNPDIDMLEEILIRAQIKDQVYVTTLTESAVNAGRPLADLITQCWELDTVIADYQRFIDWFSPLPELLRNSSTLDAELAFVIRALLIHEFRRVQLHDPQLPIELLPTNWVGKIAYELCREIYQLTFEKAEHYILSILRLEDEHAPAAAPYFYERFGGLQGANS
ncbi:MAG: phenylacetic acid degradation operon negative regulatory protein PaaX [Burkholderiaceae bacterium]|nr:phenylacetic acid degradation operon negative regulatory protein PaaX [Burkholderiaceae bacterium]